MKLPRWPEMFVIIKVARDSFASNRMCGFFFQKFMAQAFRK